MKKFIKLAERVLAIDPDAASSALELAEYFMMHPSEVKVFRDEYNV